MTTQTANSNGQTIAIALLLATAALLTGVMVASWVGTSEPAQAYSGMSGGDYILGSASVRDGKAVTYVIDSQTRKLLVYYINEKTKSIDQVTGIDFKDVVTFRK